ncbi:unnamed protein product [Schistocephalus solidus]|uniref:Secreted protein n=1 Tax=Schistocephalus solidus TaxID=70667 RepID=A0A183TKI2_SCHSO|nr:unnamed protein product [Schistocephalus solidus]
MLKIVSFLLLACPLALAKLSAAEASATNASATNTSTNRMPTMTTASATACTNCLNFLLDYFLDVLRSLLPEPFIVNESPEGFLTVRDAKVFGLKSIRRTCPTEMRTTTASNAEEISLQFCVTPSENISAVGFVKLWDLYWENPFELAELTLHNLSVTLNLTVRFPTYFDNTTESIFKLSAIQDIDTEGITIKALDENNEEGPIAVFGSTISALVHGPLFIFSKSHLAEIIKKSIRKVNKNIVSTLSNMV